MIEINGCEFAPGFICGSKHWSFEDQRHGRMARGGHGLPKVSVGLAMPDPSTPCGRPAAICHPFGHPMPYVYDQKKIVEMDFADFNPRNRKHSSGDKDGLGDEHDNDHQKRESRIGISRIGVRRGVSKGVEDGCRPPAGDHKAVRPFQGLPGCRA
jgi:hypothetical protein